MKTPSVTVLLMLALSTMPANSQQIQEELNRQAFNLAANSSTADLRTWFIPNADETARAKLNQGPAADVRTAESHGRYRCGGSSFTLLSRTKGGGTVAILEQTALFRQPTIVLNPRDRLGRAFDYGPLPPLQDMTEGDADEVWGNGKHEKHTQGVRTFSLFSKEGEKYRLEIAFGGNHIQKYRMTGPHTDFGLWKRWQIPGQEIEKTRPILPENR